MGPEQAHGGRGDARPGHRLLLLLPAYVVAALLWLAAGVFARAQWFDAWRCLGLDERSRSMQAVFWFPPHMACLDADGGVLVRDYSETIWQILLWAPVLAGGLVVAVVTWRGRASRHPDRT